LEEEVFEELQHANVLTGRALGELRVILDNVAQYNAGKRDSVHEDRKGVRNHLLTFGYSSAIWA
jgi:hypothetical protein